jgi:hypothetical protein
MMDARLESLKTRHAELETSLAEEMARPAPDFLRVRDLKRRKLFLRDAIALRERFRTPAA